MLLYILLLRFFQYKNGLLLFSDDYDNDKIIKLFRDKETINSTSSAFTDYVFDRISNFSDISVF